MNMRSEVRQEETRVFTEEIRWFWKILRMWVVSLRGYGTWLRRVALERQAIDIVDRSHSWSRWHRQAGQIRKSTLSMSKLSLSDVELGRQTRKEKWTCRFVKKAFITVSSLFKYQHVTPCACTSSVSHAVWFTQIIKTHQACVSPFVVRRIYYR